MFQSFDEASKPSQGPARLAALRKAMSKSGLDGFLVPRGDRFQGEYVSPCDERLAWLTGFTGSAGFCAALQDRAGVFVDGRYRVQVRQQIRDVFSPVDWPETPLADWLRAALPHGGKVGYDPWLHSVQEIETHEKALGGSGIHLRPVDNLVDRIWPNRPPRPSAKASAHPIELAGQSADEKRVLIAKILTDAGQEAAVLTLPDSISWLLNIRGTDIRHTPVVQAFAIIDRTGRVQLFTDKGKTDSLTMGADVAVAGWQDFVPALERLKGPVRLDRATAAVKVAQVLRDSDIEIGFATDPCILPKACKNTRELDGARAAHVRDGAAVVEFLTWFEHTAPDGTLKEIDVVSQLESFRAATGEMRDISFDTIAGAGPNGAIVHYRVNRASNRTLAQGEVLLLDSGAQYADGTTDITRTLPVGNVPDEPEGRALRRAYTRVLRGMIAISRARFPRGLAGRDLDALARAPLWMAGQDYDHGTGHGVGAYLSVHEGPQRLARTGEVPLAPGMILSNEPGYYREGAFGIRIENLVIVTRPGPVRDGDARDMLGFETLTLVPINLRLIVPEMLGIEERNWLNDYHAEVFEKISPLVSREAKSWLKSACGPI